MINLSSSSHITSANATDAVRVSHTILVGQESAAQGALRLSRLTSERQRQTRDHPRGPAAMR